MADIFQEVDEALKQDRAEKIWQEWGPTIIGTAVLIVLFTAIFSGVRTWNAHKNAVETEQLLETLDAKDVAGALETFAETTRPGHKTIALLNAAGGFVNNKQPEDAQKIYRRIVEDARIPDVFRDYARLMDVRLELEIAEKPDADALLASLGTIKGKNNPWHWHAAMDMAMIEAHHKADYAGAIETLNTVLNEESLPPSIKQRAEAMKHVYSIRALELKSDDNG